MFDAFGFPLLAQGPMDLILGVLALGLGIFLLIILMLLFSYGSLYIRAFLAGCRVPLFTIFGMKLRGVNPAVIVDAKIMLSKAGIEVDTNALETHYLARGNVQRVAQANVNADKANIKLGWARACAIDLAGRDILDAVRTSVNPKVIDCPSAEMNRPSIDGVAKDGIQLKVKARVTVRTNMERLVGGATEQTIIARVGEGIVQAIGQAQTHKEVLASPDQISKAVLHKGLDAGTAFDILSIDIADVDVGENIGAKLQTDQAQADLKVAQAKAEERRAMAVAREQEMTAETQANRAQVVLAEAEIPKAIAQAFREGNLGIMDYYNLRNVQADTEMRRAIGGVSDGKPSA